MGRWPREGLREGRGRGSTGRICVWEAWDRPRQCGQLQQNSAFVPVLKQSHEAGLWYRDMVALGPGLFKLRLRRSAESVLAPDVEIISSNGSTISYDLDRIVQGHLEEDEEEAVPFLSSADEEDISDVHGILSSTGLFDGTVHSLHENSLRLVGGCWEEQTVPVLRRATEI
ncbi:unnamed protein product [Cyprideis torosa]|uniref:Uncharacterized protein n=1 Tax=Cyprideis torosa TaxID=163714 RepID=A0A7R8W6M0_9CRUS|nr:unnamed protein product [Cyprideis torosa]CAG0886589.1 unnamed protein product [Cyprideis torosa]